MMISILAGTELLGFLLMTDGGAFNDRAGSGYFNNYWDNYLAKIQPKYTGLAGLFYNLVRHGLAHSFITKHGIFLTRGTRQCIKVNVKDELLLVDVDVFYEDFKRSYNDFVLPILINNEKNESPSVTSMQAKLDSLERSNKTKSKYFFSKLVLGTEQMRNDPFSVISVTGASGPTLSIMNVVDLSGAPVSGDVARINFPNDSLREK